MKLYLFILLIRFDLLSFYVVPTSLQTCSCFILCNKKVIMFYTFFQMSLIGSMRISSINLEVVKAWYKNYANYIWLLDLKYAHFLQFTRSCDNDDQKVHNSWNSDFRLFSIDSFSFYIYFTIRSTNIRKCSSTAMYLPEQTCCCLMLRRKMMLDIWKLVSKF